MAQHCLSLYSSGDFNPLQERMEQKDNIFWNS